MSEIDTGDERIAAIADVLLGWLTGPDSGQNDGLMDAYNALRALLRERNEARRTSGEAASLLARNLDGLMSANRTLERPDIAAILRGEAVAVPREATPDMLIAGVQSDDKRTGNQTCAHIYRAMIAASPYASKSGDDTV